MQQINGDCNFFDCYYCKDNKELRKSRSQERNLRLLRDFIHRSVALQKAFLLVYKLKIIFFNHHFHSFTLIAGVIKAGFG